MAILFENIYIWIALGAVFLLCAFALYRATANYSVLSTCLVLAVISWGLGVVLVYYVKTDRKEIRHTVQGLADAIAENDLEKVLSYVAEDAVKTRQLAQYHLELATIEWTKVRDFKIVNINYYTAPPTATVSFRGSVSGNAGVSGVLETQFTVVVNFTEVGLVKESDNKWRVTDRCVFDYPGYQSNP
ncbi:MAG: nuclear transport factor 2 family protein [Thermoguttaceae bacterium]|nr:nuclear transport factor 2 family protein [Thermoguttaceae bacterium]